MNKHSTHRLLLALVIVPLAAASLGAAPVVTQVHRVAELTFESTKDYSDPFNDITLDAVFTTPDGQMLRVPAFWAGGRTWRVRYAAPLVGRHLYHSERSDDTNAMLHGVVGEIEVQPYSGDNPLFRHGPIRIAADRRHFAHADGAPFFWLGDTWWMGLVKRLEWPGDFQTVVADRRDKGFTVIQIVAGLYPDMPAFDASDIGDGGLPWEPLYARIRPEYFDAADQRIEYLVEQGLTPFIVGCWGYHLPWLGTEKIQKHWRYLIARWGALPVVWCAAGEKSMPWYLSGSKESESQQLRREWTRVIQHIQRTEPFGRLVTTHPRRHARDEVLDATVLDFDMQQSGHGGPAEEHAALALEGWNRPPIMPVISGESRYEALEIRPPLGAKEAPQAFWAHLLNCGCAGHTYGANGIWQVNLTGQCYGKSPTGNDWGGKAWRDAMNLPGSTQLSSAKQFLLSLPWHQLAPTSSVRGAVSAAATPDGRCLLAFTTGGGALTVEQADLSRPSRGRWFDPTSGELVDVSGGPTPSSAVREFVPPGENAARDGDWVLALEVMP